MCYFLVPHTHVLCMGSGSATGKKNQVRLVHSLLKYFFKFQLWYWIKNLHYQIFKFVIDNSDISLNCLQHIQKRRNFDAKVTCHQPICLLLHAIWWCNVLPDASFEQAGIQTLTARINSSNSCLKEKLLVINIPKRQFEKQTQIVKIDVWTDPSQNFSIFGHSKS